MAQIKAKRMDESPVSEPSGKQHTIVHDLMADIENEFAEIDSLLRDIN